MINEIVVKRMGSENRNEFIEMYNLFDRIMLLPKNSVHSLERMLSLYDSNICYTFGAYYQGTLVGILTGRFYKNIDLWYGSNLFTKVDPFVNKLNLHFYSMIVSLELFDALIKIGEAQNRLAFYTNKNLRHQLAIERSMDRIRMMTNNKEIKKYRMLDYQVFYEKIYPKGYTGSEDTILQHKAFYRPGIKYNAETIVIFHTLNQNERKKLLGLDHE